MKSAIRQFDKDYSGTENSPSVHREKLLHRQGQKKIILKLSADGSLITLEHGSWFICFVPGLNKQWWHPLVNRRHKHVFAIRPACKGYWTLFEPWWTRLLVATVKDEHAMKYLKWASRGDVLLVREEVPGQSSQVRGWMDCAALISYLLGRSYWVWSPHGLYKRLKRDSSVCPVDVNALLDTEFGELVSGDSRVVSACNECKQYSGKRRKGVNRPFCIKCGRDFESAG